MQMYEDDWTSRTTPPPSCRFTGSVIKNLKVAL
jgi:hypothetical protein